MSNDGEREEIDQCRETILLEIKHITQNILPCFPKPPIARELTELEGNLNEAVVISINLKELDDLLIKIFGKSFAIADRWSMKQGGWKWWWGLRAIENSVKRGGPKADIESLQTFFTMKIWTRRFRRKLEDL
jgi:hypothetical protein